MRKFVIYILGILLIASIVNAVNVAVYTDHDGDDEQYAYCVSVNENDDAYKVLSKIDGMVFFESGGEQLLLSINDNKDKYYAFDNTSDRMIRTYIQSSNSVWNAKGIPSYDAGNNCYDVATFDYVDNFQYYDLYTHTYSNYHYCAKQGDVIGIMNEKKPNGRPGMAPFSLTPTFEEICEPISIKDIDIFVNGDKKSGVDSEGGKIRKVAPGSSITIKLEVENIGLEEFDKEIEDIKVTITIKDVNLGKDIKKSSKTFDLDPDDDEKIEFSFNISDNLDEDDYKVKIEIEGEDSENFDFVQTLKFDIEVKKPKHSLTVDNFELGKKEICAGESTNINLKISNTGLNDESASIVIFSNQLGLNVRDKTGVKEDQTIQRIYSYEVPAGTKSGAYLIGLRVDYGGSDIELASLKLTVTAEDCGKTSTATTVLQKTSGTSDELRTPAGNLITGAGTASPVPISKNNNQGMSEDTIRLIIVLFSIGMGVIIATGISVVVILKGKK